MNISQIYNAIEANNGDLFEAALKLEIENSAMSKDVLVENMAKMWDIMRSSAQKGVDMPIISKSGMTGGEGHRL